MPTAIYFNPLTTGDDAFAAQMVAQGTNIYASGNGANGAAVYKLDTTNGNITITWTPQGVARVRDIGLVE